jgi:hypothetical protein
MTTYPQLTPQTIVDQALPVAGVPGSRATFFLRATPKPFTVILAGQANQDFVVAGVMSIDVPQVARESRRFTGTRPTSQTVAFESSVDSLSSLSSNFVLSSVLASGVAAIATVQADLVKNDVFFTVAIASQGVVDAELEGGSVSGELTLTPEVDESIFVLDAEAATSETLTAEAADTLILTPEN